MKTTFTFFQKSKKKTKEGKEKKEKGTKEKKKKKKSKEPEAENTVVPDASANEDASLFMDMDDSTTHDVRFEISGFVTKTR